MNFSGNFKANKAINVFVQRLNQSRKSIRAAKPQQKKLWKIHQHDFWEMFFQA